MSPFTIMRIALCILAMLIISVLCLICFVATTATQAMIIAAPGLVLILFLLFEVLSDSGSFNRFELARSINMWRQRREG